MNKDFEYEDAHIKCVIREQEDGLPTAYIITHTGDELLAIGHYMSFYTAAEDMINSVDALLASLTKARSLLQEYRRTC